MMSGLITDEDLEKEVLPKAHKGYKGKFESLKKMIIDDGYDVRNFSRDLPLFFDSFDDNTEMVIRFHEESTESMFQRFKMIANV